MLETRKREAARPEPTRNSSGSVLGPQDGDWGGMLKATVSGSFHRHMNAITTAVHELALRGVRVLSPADPRVVDARGEFLFVASDRVRSIRLVQDRHLDSIRSADFLWLVCPDGYVGQSASMEIGFAAGAGVPIFSTLPPADSTLREYVSNAPSIEEVIRVIAARPRFRAPEGLLIDPHASIAEAHAILERIDDELSRSSTPQNSASRVHRGLADLKSQVALATSLQ